MMRTVCPLRAPSSSTMAWYAVRPVSGIAAAPTKPTPSGILATARSSTATYSAKAPMRSMGRRA